MSVLNQMHILCQILRSNFYEIMIKYLVLCTWINGILVILSPRGDCVIGVSGIANKCEESSMLNSDKQVS